MRLYIARHGEAKAKDEDPDRPLTRDGERAVRAVAGRLAPLSLELGGVRHSGKTRARQTAELLAERLGRAPAPEVHEGLGADEPVGPVRHEIEAADGDLLLVSHIPFVEKLTAALLTGREEPVLDFAAGALACLENGSEGWRLVWMLAPEVA